jgi:hypothetical protein
MIRVELGEEIERRGVWAYTVPSLALEGRSHQPLLAACRQIKRILGACGERACLFREGRSEPDISCDVEWGAAHTVKEPSGGAIHFAKFQAFDLSIRSMSEAAE